LEVGNVNPRSAYRRPVRSLRATISDEVRGAPDLQESETTPAGGCQLVVKGR
jgi:hypothetical protein